MDDWTTAGTGPSHQGDAGDPVAAVARVGALLRAQQGRIAANWALRVATLPAFRAMPDLALGDVQRRIPELLDAALIAISSSDPTVDPRPLEYATKLAAAHGRARLQDDFGIGDVLAEFHALRREVWAVLWRTVELKGVSAEPMRELESRLSETFDALTVAAAEAWAAAPAKAGAA